MGKFSKLNSLKKNSSKLSKKSLFSYLSFKRILGIFLILIGLSSLVGLWLFLSARQTLPIKTINIHGNIHYIDLKQVEKISAPALSWGFFSVDLQTIKENLVHLPWIKKIQIKRVFPDTLEIYLIEQTPVAFWNDHQFLNQEGKIFDGSLKNMTELPVLKGPDKEATQLLNLYDQSQIILNSVHLKIKQLEITDRGSYRMMTDNQIQIVLGKNYILEKLQKFAKNYPKLLKNADLQEQVIRLVDLRYSNGLAVQKTPKNLSTSMLHLEENYKVYLPNP